MTQTKGLEGIVATSSKISSIIDGQLTYGGYTIDDLAEHASFEEVVFLLWNDRLPKEEELKQLSEALISEATVATAVLETMKAAPKSANAMATIRTALSQLALYDETSEDMSTEANYAKAIKLQAQIATLVTAYARIKKGQEPIAPKTGLSYAGNFLFMLTGEEPTEVAEKAFNQALVLHADHELNASTFTARVCVATLSDVYSGVTAAMGALKGPLHGGANEAVMKMLLEIDSVEKVDEYVHNKLENKQKIMGFGHRVYKDGDPRAKHLQEMSRQLTAQIGEPKWYEMSVKIDEIVQSEKGLKPNVDFYSASTYHALGLDTELFTPIFAVSRMSGWLAHILEQYSDNRLIRPRADYTGETHRTYVSIEER
ncbi:citrate synthase [Exiguobacterium sp. A1_3_1]|uniref:Citrate synthase n=1 Tax=Exiguobacterium indicum TaxID=296995 RepID=A0AAW3MDD1_9BACL|nr:MULTISPECIES: citrate synthase [Exiguobacterium]KOP29957.1 citrate synthase [Exiguobacterium sp. BMC-KP]KTR26192.1 citrate synthase [Exiguobacterium indicum]NTY10241.1 citrate synthase [Exiguobacterium sp. JMULE1]